MLQISDLTVRMAGRLLIENASITVPTGAKAGLVGRNGTGKTTLFKVLTGDHPSETGSINLPKQARIGQVAQEAPGTEDSLLEIVLAADAERSALMAESEIAQDPDRISEILERLNDIGAYSAESRAASILAGLGFDEEAQARPASSFSGGWRMRVALAAVLFAEPDILLLDEPTNYLDLEGTLWLENFIARYSGTVLIISHDRDLLNTCVDAIVHLESQKMTFYRGNYDSFAKQRAETMELQEKARVKVDAKRKHMMTFVDRFRSKASKAKQAQSRLKAIEKLGETAGITLEHVTPISFPEPEKKVASPIIKMESVQCGYAEDEPILKGMTLSIDADDRIALLGANGNGKSTFAKLLTDRLPFRKGGVVKAEKLKVAMFAQHQLDDLRPEETPVDHVRTLMPNVAEGKVRGRVARMGLTTERMDTPTKNLSGGEKARLLLGLITFDGPNLLILDEPTNHLDVDARQSLVEALNDYTGAVILISHDRSLIDATVDRLWVVRNGGVERYDGDLETYRADILGIRSKKSKRKTEAAEPVAQPVIPKPAPARPTAKRNPNWLKNQIATAEARMAKINAGLQKIDEKLGDAGFYARSPQKAAEFADKRQELEAKLVETEEIWLKMSNELDA